MNLVLAVAIFAVVFATVGRPVWPAVVGKVTDGSPAAAAGLRTGDTIVDRRRATTSPTGRIWIACWRRSNGRPLELRVRGADGVEKTMTVTPRLRTVPDEFRQPREIWDIGAGPHLSPHDHARSAPGRPPRRPGSSPATWWSRWLASRVYTHEDLRGGHPDPPEPVVRRSRSSARASGWS